MATPARVVIDAFGGPANLHRFAGVPRSTAYDMHQEVVTDVPRVHWSNIIASNLTILVWFRADHYLFKKVFGFTPDPLRLEDLHEGRKD